MDNQSSAIEVLKKALLLEQQGKAFYEHVANSTKNIDVKAIFLMMAEEEKKHITIINEQFIHYNETGKFNGQVTVIYPEPVVREIISDKIRGEISAASFEAAAIAAAIDMENRAVKVYSERAAQTADPTEKEVYRWLADWEIGHSKMLEEMNTAILEESWNDNNFWPF